MEKVVERAGVWAIVAILAIFVTLYGMWGASILRAQQQSSISGNSVTSSAVAATTN